VAETFRFTSHEQTAFAGNNTARLIAAIPFVTGCEEAERSALAHLAVYMTELRGGRLIGAHTPADNVSPFTRLRLLSSFIGGNRTSSGTACLSLPCSCSRDTSAAANMTCAAGSTTRLTMGHGTRRQCGSR
jgi:hypothetical protein